MMHKPKHSLDEMDTQGILKLMQNGFTLQETLTLLQTTKNKTVFSYITQQLSQGKEASEIFQEVCSKQYQSYFIGFLHYLPFLQSLELSIELVTNTKRLKKDLLKDITYPITLLITTIMGLFLFNDYCFPTLIETLASFQMEDTYYLSLQKTIHIIFLLFFFFLVVAIPFLLYFTKGKRILKLYQFIAKYYNTSLFVLYNSMDFVTYFIECLKMNISTKSTLSILKTIHKRPIIVYCASLLEKQLVEGKSLEMAVEQSQLDATLERYMRLAIYSSSVSSMLEGYVSITKEKIQRRSKHIGRILQLSSYAMIGCILILVYQILLMPMQLLTQL